MQGWERVAHRFIAEGRRSTVGVAQVRRWVTTLAADGLLLDLGCGPGTPRSDPLHESGATVFAIDASPSLIDAYRKQFPRASIGCEPAEDSSFFSQVFDGVLAWGLLFLLPARTQRRVIERVAAALKPGGSFLFTSPPLACTWPDAWTGAISLSLGADAYRSILDSAGLSVVGEYEDEGENHYYEAVKRTRHESTK